MKCTSFWSSNFLFQVTVFHSELGFFRIILATQLQMDLISFTGRFLARTRSALVSWQALKNQNWNTTENIIFESSVLKHVCTLRKLQRCINKGTKNLFVLYIRGYSTLRSLIRGEALIKGYILLLLLEVQSLTIAYWADLVHKRPFQGYDWHPWKLIQNFMPTYYINQFFMG